MKHRTTFTILFSIVMTASILSCAKQKNGTSQNGTSQNEAPKDEKMDVILNITITSDYCGGAAPSDQILDQLKQQRKFSNQKFYISTIQGLQDDMKEMTTSAIGNTTVPLSQGTYYVFLPKKISAKVANKTTSQKQCDQWRNTPNGSFTVSDNNSVSFNIHKSCDPCGALRM